MGVEALTRVFEHAPHDGMELLVLIALANIADAAGVCWPGHAYLGLYARVKHERNLHQYLRALERTGNVYATKTAHRNQKAMYLVATAMSAEEIEQVLTHSFELHLDDARTLAAEMVERQRQSETEFALPLSELRKNKRKGGGPNKKSSRAGKERGIERSASESGIGRSASQQGIDRSASESGISESPTPAPDRRISRSASKSRIERSANHRGISRSASQQGIERSARTAQERGIDRSADERGIDRSALAQQGGSGDPKRGIARSEQGDQPINSKRLSEASGPSESRSDPIMIHHDPNHDPPPPAPKDANRGGGGGPSATTLYLQEMTDINVTVTEEFGDLPLDRVQALVEQKRRAGSQDGGIVIALRALRQRLAREAQQETHRPTDTSDELAARVAALDARAHAIAPPDADAFAIQWLMVYLEEGASDDEARRLLDERRTRARAVNEEYL